MPKYDYECKTENVIFEVYQTFTEDALTVCPTCQGEVKKVIRMPMLGAGTNVTRKGARDAAFSSQFEAKLEKDRPAYKSMRDQGLHPAKMFGSHELMTKAESVLEIETGRSFNGKHKQVESLLNQHEELTGRKLTPDPIPLKAEA